ncbi:MoaD/ThiS family protein [Bordetella sp. N]|uniref:MoaD/ThiS family protein n=1 Tax=Bordetella sp. N TaxID=1746199 RepID=UPI000AF7A44E|nr:MoaD/ThiS family protein [Bordetella sp. N]
MNGTTTPNTDAKASIQLLYFARVAELTGCRAETYALPAGTSISGSDLLASLGQRYPVLAGASRLRLAVNQTHAKPTVVIHPGDEVAVFEPVTGG